MLCHHGVKCAREICGTRQGTYILGVVCPLGTAHNAQLGHLQAMATLAQRGLHNFFFYCETDLELPRNLGEHLILQQTRCI